MPRKIADSVVVITGASSGIGRATALAFAREGAAVVLAARRAEALHELARECEGLGARAVAVPTDVTDEAAVQALAERAQEEFGSLDVWVNNAGVTVFGRFDETPTDQFRRVIETDLFGYVHGARAALLVFRRKGGGVLVNVASMVSWVPTPYASAYAAAKFAVRALGQSLRQELLVEGTKGVHVITVMPATFDTPLFQHSGNHTGRNVKAMPPVYPAEQVARAILRNVRRPRPEIPVGNSARIFTLSARMAPGLTEALAARMVDRQHLGDTPTASTPGNLFEPLPETTGISGGWEGKRSRRRRRFVLAALAIGAGVLAARRGAGGDHRQETAAHGTQAQESYDAAQAEQGQAGLDAIRRFLAALTV
jgi:NAD(P)-dependent dehydrogenase (short-subunit alcohol dehydrogenase family)